MSIRKLRSQFHPVLFFLAALCFGVSGIFMDSGLIARLSYLFLAGFFIVIGIRYYKKASPNGGADKSEPEG